MICRTSLNCSNHIVFGLLIGFFLCLVLHLLNHLGSVMLDLRLNRSEKIFLCLLRCQSRDSLQFLDSLLIEGFRLGVAPV